MKVDRIKIASRRGGNQMPSSGDVWFGDGRSYGWFRLPSGEIMFSSYRKRCGATEHFTFRSLARAKALEITLSN